MAAAKAIAIGTENEAIKSRDAHERERMRYDVVLGKTGSGKEVISCAT